MSVYLSAFVSVSRLFVFFRRFFFFFFWFRFHLNSFFNCESAFEGARAPAHTTNNFQLIHIRICEFAKKIDRLIFFLYERQQFLLLLCRATAIERIEQPTSKLQCRQRRPNSLVIDIFISVWLLRWSILLENHQLYISNGISITHQISRKLPFDVIEKRRLFAPLRSNDRFEIAWSIPNHSTN